MAEIPARAGGAGSVTEKGPVARRLGALFLAILVSLAVFVAFSVYDMEVLGRRPHVEGTPLYTGYFLLRTIAAISCSFLLVFILDPRGGGRARATPVTEELRVVPASAAAVLAASAVLFAVDPAVYNALAREDNVVEWGTALLAFAAAFFFARAGIRALRTLPGSFWPSSALLLLAVVLFGLGGEEISWGQRLLGVHTPELLATNRHGEMNLHNYATNEVEVLFYLWAFALLIFLPFVVERVPIGGDHLMRAIMPSPNVAIASMPVAACNYDMWNIIPIQMTFYIALFIMVVWLREGARGGRGGTALLLWILGCYVLSQLVFLALGDGFVRLHDVTEYKELFISFGFIVYGVEVHRRIESRSRVP